jgi:hypothetical protein
MHKVLNIGRRRVQGSAMIGLALLGTSASPSVRASLQLELNGRNQGWTDVTPDTRASDLPLRFDYGIKGTSPLDRVAGVGTLTWGLNNFSANSTGKEGAYSPAHVNCRRGFGIGIGVRLAFIQNLAGVETNYYKWRGTLATIRPQPGSNQNRLVTCQAVDVMDDFSRYRMSGIPTQINKRADELFATLVAAMPRQPAATQTTAGIDVFAFAFDNSNADTATGLSELQRIAQSELALIYPKGDTVQGGTLVCEGRRTRGRASTNVQVFDNTMHDMSVSRSIDAIVNKVRVTSHPRIVDVANTTVLYDMPTLMNGGGASPAISAGETFQVRGNYRDPNQKAASVGATDVITPFAGTDWQVNTSADGAGTDLTAQCSLVFTDEGNGATLAIMNSSGRSGFVVKARVRGRGLYDFEQAQLVADDLQSRVAFGENILSLDMPYQSDPVVALGAARYIIGLYKDSITNVDRFGFLANDGDDLMRAFLNREISDRIGIRETVTGLTDVIAGSTATRGFFINSVSATVSIGVPPRIFVTYTLAPADQNAYWLLAIPGASELNLTAKLGWGLFAEHVDSPHQDGHSDAAHGDTPHTDTHGDVLHGDAGHSDSPSGHDDFAHTDSPHIDTHGDVAHVDTPHGDMAHGDSHSDSSHTDVHGDELDHADHDDGTLGHDDAFSHQDIHSDAPHGDNTVNTPHDDSAHVDTPHTDTHNDVGHGDVPTVTARSRTATARTSTRRTPTRTATSATLTRRTATRTTTSTTETDLYER